MSKKIYRADYLDIRSVTKFEIKFNHDDVEKSNERNTV